MRIDVHTHCHRPEHWGEEHKRHWEPAYGNPYPLVTPEQFDEVMSAGGIDVAITFGLAASQAGVRTPNAYVAEFVKELATPTIPFASIDPADGSWKDELAEAVELGFQGVKLYPVLSLFDPLEESFDEFYGELQRSGMVAMWHMGATPSPIGRLSLTSPLIIDEIARRHPDFVQVIAHMGHPWQRDTNVVLRKNPNVFADVSGTPSRPMEAYLALVGAQEWGVVDKLLFGSDFPLWTPEEALENLNHVAQLRSGDLPYVRQETVDSIVNADALSLLGLRDPRSLAS